MNSRLYSSAFVAGLFYTCVQSSPTPAVPLKPADALTLDVHAFPQITRTPSEQLRQTVWSTLPWVAFWGLFRVWLLNDFDWDHQDQSWANGKIPSLYFQACSGAKFDAIPGQLDDMDKQISDREAKYRKDTSNPKLTDVVPEFATMTIGGNDAGFFGVVSNCIFHNDIGRDYGPDYPDPKGECAKVINETTHRVANDDEFAKGLAEQIEHVLGHSKFKDKSNFKLFVTGHARFFNQDDPACDKYGLRLIGSPSLTRILRNAINDLVLLVNHKVEETVHKANIPKAIFVDFDSGFEGHRFCEPNDSSGYLGNRKQRINSWFWSFSVFDNYSLPPGTAALCDPDLDVNCPDLQPDNPEYGYQVSGGSSDPSQTPSATRTFHPKKSGHTAIKDKTGGLDGSYTPVSRDMDCFFNC